VVTAYRRDLCIGRADRYAALLAVHDDVRVARSGLVVERKDATAEVGARRQLDAAVIVEVGKALLSAAA
jgi:hypothetical protein